MKKNNFHSTAEYKITEQKFWTTQLVCKKNHLVVALTETWTSEFNNAKLFQIENCQEVILCNRKKRWVCVVIYIKNNTDFEVLRCEIGKATELLANFVLNTRSQFAITIVYKPPYTNEDIFWLEKWIFI